MPELSQPLKIFIIYAREDTESLNLFKKNLTPFERRGELALWYDAKITPGEEWEVAIKNNLKTADIIVLLLSSDFFHSEYIEKIELKEAFERHDRGEVVITPVVVRHCLWQEYTQIKKLQVLPENGIPVSSTKSWESLDEAYTNVASGIMKAARGLQSRRTTVVATSNEALLISKALQQAVVEYDKENFAEAYRIFDLYKNHSLFTGELQRRLGRMFHLGLFVEKNIATAKYWYEKAITNGDAWAMHNYGLLYESDTPPNFSLAKRWYEKAFESGYLLAMNNLGLIYYHGKGEPVNLQQAKIWFEKGAELGDEFSMINLGQLFKNLSTPDFEKARYWYEKAAEKGNATAMNSLGILYEHGDGKEYKPDYSKAKMWYEKAAQKGVVEAMYNLGLYYSEGGGVPPDFPKAEEWYKKAAEKGYADAMYKLGMLFDAEMEHNPDFIAARIWYGKAANLGNAKGMYKLGKLHYQGKGGNVDYVKARLWYEQAAENNIGDAMNDLGVLYHSGKIMSPDYRKAKYWYEKAAALGDTTAMRNLALLYRTGGNGVDKNEMVANEWTNKALQAEKG